MPAEPIVVQPGHGEVVGDTPDRRVEILSDDDSLHATWSRFAAGRDGADLHVHRHHTDLFYVLAGELTIRLGLEGDGVIVPAGTLARIPPLVVHGFRNASDADVRYLNLHAPGRGFADYMRALRDGRAASYDQHQPPDDGGRAATHAVFCAEDAGVVETGPGLRTVVLADVGEILVAVATAEPGIDVDDDSPGHVESRYVLEGELAIAIGGGRELRAHTGTWLQVPPGIEHTTFFPGPGLMRFLQVRTPRARPEP